MIGPDSQGGGHHPEVLGRHPTQRPWAAGDLGRRHRHVQAIRRSAAL